MLVHVDCVRRAQGPFAASDWGSNRPRSNCPSASAIGILLSGMAMVIPRSLSVVMVPLASDVDLDTIATVMLLVFAAGVGWFLWRHK